MALSAQERATLGAFIVRAERGQATPAEEAEIDRLLARESGPPIETASAAPAAPAAAKPSDTAGPGRLAALGYGAAEGASLGFAERLAGLGTEIGERAASFAMGVPPRPGAYQEGREEYAGAREAAREAHKGIFTGAQLAGGVLPSLALSPVAATATRAASGAGAAAKVAARVAQPALEGALAGAGATKEDDLAELAKGAAGGAALGVAAGELLGKLRRAAPERSTRGIVKDIVESEAGRATPTAVKQLAADLDDVIDVVKRNPDLKKKLGGPAKDALPLAEEKLAQESVKRAPAYAAFDAEVPQTTVYKLQKKLLAAQEKAANPREERAIDAMMKNVVDFWGPRWAGQPTMPMAATVKIPTIKLREWVTDAQNIAGPALSEVTPKEAAKLKASMARIAKGVLDDHLDSAPSQTKTVAEVREANRQISALSRIKDALLERNSKEQGASLALTERGVRAGSGAAGAAALLAGQPELAVAALAAPTAAKLGRGAARLINDKILAPLESAARKGEPFDKTWGNVARQAASYGITESAARALYDSIARNN